MARPGHQSSHLDGGQRGSPPRRLGGITAVSPSGLAVFETGGPRRRSWDADAALARGRCEPPFHRDTNNICYVRTAAKINAVKAGWDDVEYLQGLVTKLRQQVARGSSGFSNGDPADVAMSFEQAQQSAQVAVKRLAMLQKEHTDVSER